MDAAPLGEMDRATRGDAELLRRYAQDGSEEAFAEFVRRHVDLVYSAALRRCRGDVHRAEEITQSVFTAVARRANALSRHPALDAWLHTATRNAATNAWTSEQRRRRREQEAMRMFDPAENEHSPDWAHLRNVLDEAMDELGEPERMAVLLRYFENKSFPEIGRVLGANENAVRMRTQRALDKLRDALGRRGIATSVAALGEVLIQHSVSASPVPFADGLASKSIAAAHATRPGVSWTRLPLAMAVCIPLAVVVAIAIRTRTASQESIATPGPPDEHALVSTTQVAPRNVTTIGSAGVQRAVARNGAGETDATTLLRRMAERYASLTSYSDSGEVTRGDQANTATRFRITGGVPGKLRVEFTRGLYAPRTTTIISNGTRVTCLSAVQSSSTESSGTSPIAMLASRSWSSDGACYHVPRLLVAAHERKSRLFSNLAELRDPSLLPDATVEGTVCRVVRGVDANGSAYTLWIGRDDLMIRKVQTTAPVTTMTLGTAAPRTGPLVTEIHRDIRLNEPVPDDTFEIPAEGR